MRERARSGLRTAFQRQGRERCRVPERAGAGQPGDRCAVTPWHDRQGNTLHLPLLRCRRFAADRFASNGNRLRKGFELVKETRSTCPYCGVGCGVIIESQGEQITGVRGDPEHPANFGRLCTKGSSLHLTAAAPITRQARLLHPLRRENRGGKPVRVSWDEALGLATDTFARVVRESGPDAIGFYISGQLLTEDYYVFNKLAKGLVGTNNIDTNSRLCMSSAAAGYKLTLGADAPPNCYDDIGHAQCIFIAGSNTAWAHPVLFRRIEGAKAANPHLKIVVCDPRRTDTAGIADLYLPIQPGTDVMLFNGLLHIMLWEGWVRHDYIGAHTSSFDE